LAGSKITLLTGMQPAEEFSTLAHELAHLCGAGSYVATPTRNRLNRPFHISEHSHLAKETKQVGRHFQFRRNFKTASDQRRSIFQKDLPVNMA
jgi:hypothetical protein